METLQNGATIPQIQKKTQTGGEKNPEACLQHFVLFSQQHDLFGNTKQKVRKLVKFVIYYINT